MMTTTLETGWKLIESQPGLHLDITLATGTEAEVKDTAGALLTLLSGEGRWALAEKLYIQKPDGSHQDLASDEPVDGVAEHNGFPFIDVEW